MLSLLMLGGLAQAASWSGWFGPTWTTDDPFVRRRGAQLGVEYAPAPVFAVRGTVQAFPTLGEADFTPLSRLLIARVDISPSFSRMVAGANLGFACYPFQAQRGRLSSRVGVHAGFGAVYTRDDLEVLQADPSDPIYSSTEVEWHGSLTRGLSADFSGSVVGMHLAMDRLYYVETVASTELEIKDHRMFTLGISFKLP